MSKYIVRLWWNFIFVEKEETCYIFWILSKLLIFLILAHIFSNWFFIIVGKVRKFYPRIICSPFSYFYLFHSISTMRGLLSLLFYSIWWTYSIQSNYSYSNDSKDYVQFCDNMFHYFPNSDTHFFQWLFSAMTSTTILFYDPFNLINFFLFYI